MIASFRVVKRLKVVTENCHMYMTNASRISIAGLNDENVARFARAIDETVRNVD